MFQALRVRDFRLLWAGGLISALGSWLLVLALPAHVFLVTGSLPATGLTLAAEYVPLLLLGPVAGAVADRCDRRRLMIAACLLCAASVAAMLAGLGPHQYPVLYAALIAENSGIVLYTPAASARTPEIVGTGPILSSAGSLSTASSGIVRLIGGPLGGLLLTAIGIRWLVGADAVSYLVAAGAIALTSRSGRAAARPGPGPGGQASVARRVLADLTEGVRALAGQPVARALLPVTIAFLAANAALSAVLIPFGVQHLGGSQPTGFLLASLGAGFLAGAPVIRWLLDRVQPRTLMAAALAVNAAACFALFTSTALARALPAAAGVGLSGSLLLVAAQVTVQRVIPNAVLGRVTAVFLTAEAAATLAGAGAGPFLTQSAGFTGLVTVTSLVMVAAAALAWWSVPRLATLVPRRAGVRG